MICQYQLPKRHAQCQKEIGQRPLKPFKTLIHHRLHHPQIIKLRHPRIHTDLLPQRTPVLRRDPLARARTMLHKLITPQPLALSALEILRAPLEQQSLDVGDKALFDAQLVVRRETGGVLALPLRQGRGGIAGVDDGGSRLASRQRSRSREDVHSSQMTPRTTRVAEGLAKVASALNSRISKRWRSSLRSMRASRVMARSRESTWQMLLTSCSMGLERLRWLPGREGNA